MRTVLQWIATVLGAVVLAAALLIVSGYVALVAWDLANQPKLEGTAPAGAHPT